MIICLGRGADLHMAQLIGFTFLVLPFWCRLTRVVPDKIEEGRKMVVYVCVCVLYPYCCTNMGEIWQEE